jgi:predicted nucleotidyltransferase
VRLNQPQIEAIKRTAVSLFGQDVVVRLFGSRLDDNRRGGDIDLHLEVASGQHTLKNELAFELQLQKILGEQKIDVVIHERGHSLQPIDKIAIDQGIAL